MIDYEKLDHKCDTSDKVMLVLDVIIDIAMIVGGLYVIFKSTQYEFGYMIIMIACNLFAYLSVCFAVDRWDNNYNIWGAVICGAIYIILEGILGWLFYRIILDDKLIIMVMLYVVTAGILLPIGIVEADNFWYPVVNVLELAFLPFIPVGIVAATVIGGKLIHISYEEFKYVNTGSSGSYYSSSYATESNNSSSNGSTTTSNSYYNYDTTDDDDDDDDDYELSDDDKNYNEAIEWRNKGVIEFNRGDYRSAMTSFDIAHTRACHANDGNLADKLFKDIHDCYVELGNDAWNTAKEYSDRGDYATARNYMIDAREYYRQGGDTGKQLQAAEYASKLYDAANR